MSNPFTRFLQQWSQDPDLEEFVAYWDALEALVVEIYRGKRPPQAAEADFTAVWAWLRAHYVEWEEALRPFWQNTRAAGKPTTTDPFRLLLGVERPADIVGNWSIMQHLPAAREALNQYIISRETA